MVSRGGRFGKTILTRKREKSATNIHDGEDGKSHPRICANLHESKNNLTQRRKGAGESEGVREREDGRTRKLCERGIPAPIPATLSVGGASLPRPPRITNPLNPPANGEVRERGRRDGIRMRTVGGRFFRGVVGLRFGSLCRVSFLHKE